MGGDDLGSDDDEYLNAADDSLRGSFEDDGRATQASAEPNKQQRKRPLGEVTSDDDDNNNESKSSTDKIATSSSKTKKRKMKKSKMDGGMSTDLEGGGETLYDASAEQQSSFLTKWTDQKFSPNHLFACSCSSQSSKQQQKRQSKLSYASSTMLDRITQVISKKKLKNWNQKSPMVVVVCLSARRAVQILKELAPSKLRVAKLFAKHMNMEQQIQQLQQSTFSIAVGTPHRLATLASSQQAVKDEKSKEKTTLTRKAVGVLSFERTQLLVLDTHLNEKQYSVCTLPDTAPFSLNLLTDYVYPELIRRKDIRVAFL